MGTIKVKYQRIPSEDVQKTVLGDSYDIFNEQINSQQGDVILDLLSNEGMSGSKSEFVLNHILTTLTFNLKLRDYLLNLF